MSYLPSQLRTICIPVPNVFVTGSTGAAVDRITVSIPTTVSKWSPNKILAYCENANATIATASFNFSTAPGTSGYFLNTTIPAVLTTMTTTGQWQTFAVSGSGSVYTSSGITIRQVDAAAGSNTGSVFFGIYIDVIA